MKILVGFPCLDFVAPEFTTALAGITAHAAKAGIEPVIKMAAGSKPEDARIYLAEQCIANGCDRLFMLDADIWAPPNTLTRLASAVKPIIAATYATKDGQRRPLGFEQSGQPIDVRNIEVRQANYVPGGVSLTDRALFEGLPQPWFSSPYDAPSHRHKDEFYFFCDLVRGKAGDPWIDPALSREVSHWGPKGNWLL